MERLDTAERAEAEKNLRDIARINRWFGGHGTLVRLLRLFVGPKDQFSLLDVGAASGDMGRYVQKRFPNAQVVSLDRRPLHLNTVTTARIAADARSLPFADASFDLVMCSSLLHHCANNEVIVLLRGMRRIARPAVIVLDLERHLVAYFFLPLTRTFLRWSELRVHDGCASVEAAFRVSELELLARSLAPARVVVQRHVPWFRVSMILEGVNTFQSHGLFVRSAGLVCSEARPRASGSSHAFYTAALWERRFDASASHFGRCDINHSNRYQMDRRVNHFHSNLGADCSWVGIQLRAHH